MSIKLFDEEFLWVDLDLEVEDMDFEIFFEEDLVGDEGDEEDEDEDEDD